MISFADVPKTPFGALSADSKVREKRVPDTYIFRRQTIAVAIFASCLFLIACPPSQAKGLFGSEEKDSQSQSTLQAQLYQIQQQLTQLQAQMTQLQLQMNKRTTVIEQKQNSLHETLTQYGTALKGLAREEQQIEHQVQTVQTTHTPEPVAVKAPFSHAQPHEQTLEESADYEVSRVNTKTAPAYKSHIQDVETPETSAAASPVKKPVSIAAKPPNAVVERKSRKSEEKAEKIEKLEKEEKTEAKSGNRLLPGFFGDRLSKAKKEAQGSEKQSAQGDQPAQKSLNSGKPRVKAAITIKAPPEVVWEAVHEQRKTDPELAYSKVLRQGVNEATLEQKFTVLPIVGTAVCVMNTQEVPNRRIDYQMVKSDKFKAMEGSWVLTPSADGKSTNLELTSHIDMGLPVPRAMMNGVTKQKLERRLAHVRELAEKSRLAQKPGAQPQ